MKRENRPPVLSARDMRRLVEEAADAAMAAADSAAALDAVLAEVVESACVQADIRDLGARDAARRALRRAVQNAASRSSRGGAPPAGTAMMRAFARAKAARS